MTSRANPTNEIVTIQNSDPRRRRTRCVGLTISDRRDERNEYSNAINANERGIGGSHPIGSPLPIQALPHDTTHDNDTYDPTTLFLRITAHPLRRIMTSRYRTPGLSAPTGPHYVYHRLLNPHSQAFDTIYYEPCGTLPSTRVAVGNPYKTRMPLLVFTTIYGHD